MRRTLPTARSTQVAGFRYFNVYGPREQHKGRMASVAFHHFGQLREQRQGEAVRRVWRLRLPGQQLRDFVYVDDVVAVNLWFLEHPERSGVFNLGTGRAQPFNDVAHATINACRALRGEARAQPRAAGRSGLDRVHPTFRRPWSASISATRKRTWRPCARPAATLQFADVATGVRRYVEWLAAASGLKHRFERARLRKIVSAPAAESRWSRSRPLVFTNGVFDVLHRDMSCIWRRHAQLGAALLVAVNTDASARKLGKGADRPLNRERTAPSWWRRSRASVTSPSFDETRRAS